MNKAFRTLLILIFLTPGLASRSQTVSVREVKPEVLVSDSADACTPVVPADTIHITPAMIDSIRGAEVVEEFQRELESVVMVPKGQWIAGLSFGYSQSNHDSYQFLVLEDIRADQYSVQINPKLLYAFKDDMAVGLKFGYTRSLMKLENADIVLGQDTEYGLDHIYSLSHNYYGTVLFRNYFSLGRTRRFGFFSEVQLQLGGGQSKLTQGRGESLTGNYETNFQAGVGVMPGLVVFLSNYSAIEVNIGVLGFNYRKTKSIKDQVYVSHRKSQSANFRINLFSIQFGASFYL